MKDILLNILAPILLMVSLGSLMRWKFKLDMSTLGKLNIYLFVPAFIFHNISTSTLRAGEMLGVVAVTLIQVALLGTIVWTIGKAFHVGHKTLSAVLLAVMFYNSGNFGLPLAELAYPVQSGKDGAAVQTFVMMTQNITQFTVGLFIAAWGGSGEFGRGFITLFRTPMIPALAAALLGRWWAGGDAHAIPRAIADTAKYLSNGLVPLALVTLGAQMAVNPRWPRWRPISLVLFLRLIYAPVQMGGILWLLNKVAVRGSADSNSVWRGLTLWPWPAEMLVLTAGVPTAVNTLLVTLELDGDAELAADCVFWTTLVSCLTITGWLMAVRS